MNRMSKWEYVAGWGLVSTVEKNVSQGRGGAGGGGLHSGLGKGLVEKLTFEQCFGEGTNQLSGGRVIQTENSRGERQGQEG